METVVLQPLNDLKAARLALGDISNGMAYNMIKSGELKVVKLGRRTFVTDVEIKRKVAELVAAAEAEAVAKLKAAEEEAQAAAAADAEDEGGEDGDDDEGAEAAA